MQHPPLRTVAALDLPRYLGTWYEIDRLPMRHEPADATDVSAHYSLDAGGAIGIRNRCLHAGVVEQAIGQARPIDASNSRLEVSFLPSGLRWLPFTKGDYWVMLVDADYHHALVGSPDRHYLWLLARQPWMDETIRQHYIGYARQQGFAVEQLIHTPHTGQPTA